MEINVTLTYFGVSCTIITSPRKNKLTWYGKSCLLKIEGLNVVSNTKYDPNSGTDTKEWNFSAEGGGGGL